MHCTHCGFDNPPGFRFCGGCGSRLEEETGPAPREPLTASEPATAERRQLTVLFCDLVGSTDLSERLDPEELREVVQQYQEACAEVVARFEGHVAQYLGDGLLIYFGYPQAHEDDALRGLHAGLGILDAVAALSDRLEAGRGLSLAVRLGLHTGEVVAGEVGAGGRREQLALGRTPNVAARLQALAEPGTLVVSEDIRRLAAGQFSFIPLGEHLLKGISRPFGVFQVVGESGEGRFAAASARGLAPLVGRARELAVLRERFARAWDGGLQAVVLIGEAGIGKSRLLHDLRKSLAGEPHTWGTWQASPFYQNSALYPCVGFLHKALRFTADEAPLARLRKLERAVGRAGLPLADVVPLLAAFLALPAAEAGYPPLAITPQRQKERTLEALADLLVRQAEKQPVVFAVEDLHWVDPTTLEYLDLLLERAGSSRVLLLMTTRPEIEIPWPASQVDRLPLDRLSDAEVEDLVCELTGGRPLPARVVTEIVQKTDGVPLFVEELTHMILESGLLEERGGRFVLVGTLPPLAIPSTLQDSLMARLDRLEQVKEIAQLGAVLGREFDLDMLRAVSSLPEEDLARGLARMVESEILLERGQPPQKTWIFRHALLQDAAYRSLLKSTRQRLHQRIAGELEQRAQSAEGVRPELLAHHFTEAGLAGTAVGYWLLAGQRALASSANREAAAHLSRALEQLASLPAGLERDGRELAIQITLAPALCATQGYAGPEVERVLARAHELCRTIGRAPQIPTILYGLVSLYAVRGDLYRAFELGHELLEQAEADGTGSRLDRFMAHLCLGFLHLYRGEFTAAREHIDRTLDVAAAEPKSLLPTGEEAHTAKAWLAQVLWYQGYPDQALAAIQDALRAARESGHIGSLLYTLCFAAYFHHLRREPQAVRDLAQEVIDLSRQYGSFWEAIGNYFLGWALAHLEDWDAGVRRMCQGLDAYRAPGNRVTQTCYITAVAGMDTRAAKAERQRLLDEALAAALATGERYWESEIHRIHGELALAGNGTSGAAQAEAERRFLRALDIARATQGKSLELRAATSLARLRHSQGRTAEGRALLSEVYGWFTEGFDTGDLREAREILAAMAAV